jgi:hypothetical protein
MCATCAGSQPCRARHITANIAVRDDDAGECELRDVIQRICLKHRFYGYRRVSIRIPRRIA